MDLARAAASLEQVPAAKDAPDAEAVLAPFLASGSIFALGSAFGSSGGLLLGATRPSPQRDIQAGPIAGLPAPVAAGMQSLSVSLPHFLLLAAS